MREEMTIIMMVSKLASFRRSNAIIDVDCVAVLKKVHQPDSRGISEDRDHNFTN